MPRVCGFGLLAAIAYGKDPDGKACKDWRSLVGPINRDISANEMMWAFFQRYRR